MKRLLSFVLLGIVAILSVPRSSFAAVGDEQKTIQVTVCELVSQPQTYDGVRVKGTATYAIGTHSAVLFDTCNGKTKTLGLALASSYNSNSRAHKRLSSRAQRLGARVSFVGVFSNERGNFLDEDFGIVAEQLLEIEQKNTSVR